MQVLCKATNSGGDIRCNICGQAFDLVFTRATAKERADARYMVQMALRDQHLGTDAPDAHPAAGFNVKPWSNDLKFSAAAFQSKIPDWAF